VKSYNPAVWLWPAGAEPRQGRQRRDRFLERSGPSFRQVAQVFRDTGNKLLIISEIGKAAVWVGNKLVPNIAAQFYMSE
jgi:hypothetical protein